MRDEAAVRNTEQTASVDFVSWLYASFSGQSSTSHDVFSQELSTKSSDVNEVCRVSPHQTTLFYWTQDAP